MRIFNNSLVKCKITHTHIPAVTNSHTPSHIYIHVYICPCVLLLSAISPSNRLQVKPNGIQGHWFIYTAALWWPLGHATASSILVGCLSCFVISFSLNTTIFILYKCFTVFLYYAVAVWVAVPVYVFICVFSCVCVCAHLSPFCPLRLLRLWVMDLAYVYVYMLMCLCACVSIRMGIASKPVTCITFN